MIWIRADGNAKIGAGHLMRCMTIAEEFLQMTEDKTDVCFVCADEESAHMARERGFWAVALHTDYRQPETELPRWETIFSRRQEACKQSEESQEFLENSEEWEGVLRKGEQSAVFLVDSYYVTDAYLTALRQYGKVCLMDDLAGRAYPADMIINYNLYAEQAVYGRLYQTGHTEFALGSAYVPLRRQFGRVSYQIRDEVKNILITTGGGDSENIAGAIYEDLSGVWAREFPGVSGNFHVLVGRFSPHFEKWQRLAAEREELTIHFDVKNMAEWMCRCDLAVTAGGSTIYELAAVGVPFICFSYAENQEQLTEYIGRHGVAGYAGAWHKEPETVRAEWRRQFEDLCRQRKLREQYYDAERKLVDGGGARRLAERLRS